MIENLQQWDAYTAWLKERGLTPEPGSPSAAPGAQIAAQTVAELPSTSQAAAPRVVTPHVAAKQAAPLSPFTAKSRVTTGAPNSVTPPASATPVETTSASPNPSVASRPAVTDLDRYKEKAAQCRSCQYWSNRREKAWGTGPSAPKLVLITDAPHVDGKWFTADEQDLLNRILAAIKVSPDQIYVTSLVLCPKHPGKPLAMESILSCREFLLAELRSVQDSPIVVLGEETAQHFSGITGDFAANVAKWHLHQIFQQRPIRAIYHPRDMLINADFKRPTWAALQDVMTRI